MDLSGARLVQRSRSILTHNLIALEGREGGFSPLFLSGHSTSCSPIDVDDDGQGKLERQPTKASACVLCLLPPSALVLGLLGGRIFSHIEADRKG